MNTTIFKQGNSCAVRLPKKIMDALGLLLNDEVELNIEDDKIVIQKKVEHKTIADYFEGYESGYYVAEDSFDDAPIGREVL